MEYDHQLSADFIKRGRRPPSYAHDAGACFGIEVMGSEKTTVIEHLFWQRHDPVSGRVSPDVVTFDDIVEAIHQTRVPLSAANPANFWKDIIRTPSGNKIWPDSVLRAGYTGDDAIGSSTRACFRFVALPPGQSTAFPPAPSPDVVSLRTPLRVESLSLSTVERGMSREDSGWIAHVAQRLRIVEAHFSLVSAIRPESVEHLQTQMRLPGGVVDLVYVLWLDGHPQWLVGVEAKSRREAIWLPQISRTAAALRDTASAMGISGVIPMAVKAVEDSVIQTVEFRSTRPGGPLEVAYQGAFRLEPSVPGI